ncbi:MAG: DMT family transporter [Anaerolineae bacterium]
MTMKAYASLGFGALCIAFAPIFVKWADAPAGVIALYRIGVATAVLMPLFWHRYRAILQQVKPQLVAVSMLGGAFFAADLVLWNSGLKLTSAANATLIANTTPIWVGLAAYFWLGETISRRFLVGLVAAMSGAALVMGDDFLRGFSLGQGDLLALGAAFFYSAYILVTKRARDHLDTLFYIWLANLGAALALSALALGGGLSLGGYSNSTYAAMIAQGLVSQVIGVSAIAWATGHLPASFVSVGLLSQPVMAAILAYILLSEGFTPLQVGGGAVILAGIYLAASEQQRSSRPGTGSRPATAAPSIRLHAYDRRSSRSE